MACPCQSAAVQGRTTSCGIFGKYPSGANARGGNGMAQAREGWKIRKQIDVQIGAVLGAARRQPCVQAESGS